MNLTSQQQVGITQTLAEIMEIDGKSMAGVTDVMGRFQYAMSVGNLEFRDLKAITKEYPDTAAAFSAATGKSIVELEAMAKAGKFNADVIRQVMEGLEQNTEVHKKHLQIQYSVDDIQKRMNVSYVRGGRDLDRGKRGIDVTIPRTQSLDEAAMRIANHFKTVHDSVTEGERRRSRSERRSRRSPGMQRCRSTTPRSRCRRTNWRRSRGRKQKLHDQEEALGILWSKNKITNEEYDARLKELNGAHTSRRRRRFASMSKRSRSCATSCCRRTRRRRSRAAWASDLL
jgi:tape measure domain-containing protein